MDVIADSGQNGVVHVSASADKNARLTLREGTNNFNLLNDGETDSLV